MASDSPIYCSLRTVFNHPLDAGRWAARKTLQELPDLQALFSASKLGTGHASQEMAQARNGRHFETE